MFLSPQQITKQTLTNLQKTVNKHKEDNRIFVQGIDDNYQLQNLKRIIMSTLNIEERYILTSTKTNFNKAFSSSNMVKQATGRVMDLKEYSLDFTIKYIKTED